MFCHFCQHESKEQKTPYQDLFSLLKPNLICERPKIPPAKLIPCPSLFKNFLKRLLAETLPFSVRLWKFSFSKMCMPKKSFSNFNLSPGFEIGSHLVAQKKIGPFWMSRGRSFRPIYTWDTCTLWTLPNGNNVSITTLVLRLNSTSKGLSKVQKT